MSLDFSDNLKSFSQSLHILYLFSKDIPNPQWMEKISQFKLAHNGDQRETTEGS